jgi:hypothetical protein
MSALWLILTDNYNWTQDFLVLLLSPILYNEQSSLILINYFSFFLTTVFIFKTALACEVSRAFSFLIAIGFAAMPWNFHALMEFNLTSLMPEPVFVAAYLCATIALCWFAANPSSVRTAMATGLILGIAIWSRGNAFIYVTMPLAGLGLIGLNRFIWRRQWPSRRIVATTALAALICLAMLSVYFWFMYHAIYDYYSEVASSIVLDDKKIEGSKWLLLNMPGLAIADQWFGSFTQATSWRAIALTILAHGIVIYSGVRGLKATLSDRRDEILIGALGLIGSVVFYLDLLLAIFTFSSYYADEALRDLHSLEPAIVGFICCALSALCAILSKRTIFQKAHGLVYIVVGVLLAHSSATIIDSSFKYLKNQLGREGVTADDLRAFSLRFAEATANKQPSFLWYGAFNSAIVDYYVTQSGGDLLHVLPPRTNKDLSIWATTENPDLVAPKSFYADLFDYMLENSGYLIIPERLDAFQDLWPSPIVAHRKALAAALNSQETAPDFLVWAVIEEETTRVLVLKKPDGAESDADLEPLPRNWGAADQEIGREFKGAIVVRRRPLWQFGASARLPVSYARAPAIRAGSRG